MSIMVPGAVYTGPNSPAEQAQRVYERQQRELWDALFSEAAERDCLDLMMRLVGLMRNG